jgi:hypothetical protein
MVKKQKITLPKTDKVTGIPYLSYSQISTWKKSKRDYIRQYFFGEDFSGMSDYMDFGSKVGNALEKNDFSEFTKEEQKFLKTIPRYDQFEREINLQMDGYFVKGFIDTNTTENTEKGELVKKIADYKTGEIEKKESEYASDDYIQLDIYAASIQQETGVLPEEVSVFLIDRTGNAFKGEPLRLGERYITITKKVDDKRVKVVMNEVNKIAQEISDYYQVFLKLNGLM